MGRAKLSTVTATGDRIKSLQRLRQELAAAIDDGPPPRDLSSLARRLMLVMEELDELGAKTRSAEERKVDELRERRARRSAAG